MVGHDESGSILGYVWPRLTRCPFCGCGDYTEAGHSRSGILRYRFCANPLKMQCPGRQDAYKVMAIAMHVDRGGDQSEVVPVT